MKSLLMWVLHCLGYSAIVVSAAPGIRSGPAGEVTTAIVIALAMIPLLLHLAQRNGKLWSVWHMYAFVGLMAGATWGVRMFDPPRWIAWSIPALVLLFGLTQTIRHQRKQKHG
jgi:hypothetical protein